MAIIVKDLSYTYQPHTVFAREALKHVSLTVNNGEFVGILGASGSGKSTLMQHINGVIPSRDRVTVNGLTLGGSGVNRRDVVANAAMAFQYPEHQLVCDTVEEELSFGCRNLGYGEEKTTDLVAQYARAFGLPPHFFPRSPFQLSGGEKRRVALASIFAMDTPILLLDEPTVGLDLQGKADFLKVMTHLQKEGAKTVIWIGHDIEEIAKVATRLVVMEAGSILLDGDTEAVLGEEDTLLTCGILPPRRCSLEKTLRELYGAALNEDAGQKILGFLAGEAGDVR